ncbi:MAG: hypothetical protein ACKO6Q_07360, partial [Bacteroidota bacterium]
MIRAGVFLIFLAFAIGSADGQRSYASHSVLASGSWYKLSAVGEGLFKLEGARLQAAGVGPLP